MNKDYNRAPVERNVRQSQKNKKFMKIDIDFDDFSHDEKRVIVKNIISELDFDLNEHGLDYYHYDYVDDIYIIDIVEMAKRLVERLSEEDDEYKEHTYPPIAMALKSAAEILMKAMPNAKLTGRGPES